MKGLSKEEILEYTKRWIDMGCEIGYIDWPVNSD
jgi:hypothetical protein